MLENTWINVTLHVALIAKQIHKPSRAWHSTNYSSMQVCNWADHII